jgi:SWI/SNF-related matrix-associated actin-dependent regulator of chromatin subfamily A3
LVCPLRGSPRCLSVCTADIVTTGLYPHQKQALAFLLEREKLADLPPRDAPESEAYVGLWRLKRSDPAYWTNVVTGVSVPFSPLRPELPPQCRGAILADDMGLGKTIVIISLIANTMQEGKAFAKSKALLGRHPPSFDAMKRHPVSTKGPVASSFQSIMPFGMPADRPPAKKKKGPGKKELKREEAEARRLSRLTQRSGATLIICPLSTVQNWESQIKEHTKAKSLSVHVYHGPSRCQSPEVLANYDVIITTFSTLGTEYSKQARAEETSSSEDDTDEVEVTDANGQPLNGKKKQKKKRPKPPPGTNTSSPLQQIEWFRVVLDEAQ